MKTINPTLRQNNHDDYFDPYGLLSTKQVMSLLGTNRLTVDRYKNRGHLTKCNPFDTDTEIRNAIAKWFSEQHMTTTPTNIRKDMHLRTGSLMPPHSSTIMPGSAQAIEEVKRDWIDDCSMPRDYFVKKANYFPAIELYYLLNKNGWPIPKKLTGSAAAWVFIHGFTLDSSKEIDYGPSRNKALKSVGIASQADIEGKLNYYNSLRPALPVAFSRGKMADFRKLFEN